MLFCRAAAGEETVIRISKKADYAILILTHLARQAARGDEIPVSATELAGSIPLGKPTIANLLKALTRAAVLESIRGVHGGYRLARAPADINVAEVLDAVEGPLAIVDCATAAPLAEVPCDLSSCCTNHQPMRLLQQRIRSLLETTTLDDFVSSCPVSNILAPSQLLHQPPTER